MSSPTSNRMREVLVIEPDHGAASAIRDVLENDGFRVKVMPDGESLLALLPTHHPDLVILALMLPGIQGLDVLREIQTKGRTPTIVVSQKASEADRVVGLEVGADDYLAKPFSPRELLARVHAVLRRAAETHPARRLEFADFSMDLETRDVLVDGVPVELTALEFDLLAFMASAPRQVFSRETLLDRVWGSSADWQTAATVSEHIHRLRRKIERDASRPRRIETLRGAGYRFVP